MSERTIAAIATSGSNSALGVIRISGDQAVEIADRVFFPFSGKPLCGMKGYTAAYGEIKSGREVLDDGIALVFKAPHSFTGENTVEISVHGGSLILRSVLRLILSQGAYPAEPGEFTKRAFLNGKTDLTRAESIMGLISAQSEAQLKLSRAAHLGRTAEKIQNIISELTKADAAILVYFDYPDEDIDGLDRDNFTAMLVRCEKSLENMLCAYDSGRAVREGIETVIAGKPNVGKSTLMNMLSGADRSIVTDIAGTTRDVVEETVIIGEVILRLADTAGIRETSDIIENIGVNKAKDRIETAQLILAVFDCTEALDENDLALLDGIKGKNTIVVINKTDLESKIDMSVFEGFDTVEISAKENLGYDELCGKIAEISGAANLDPDSGVLINERQRSCASRALQSLKAAGAAIADGSTLDAVSVCVDEALGSLFELTGQRVTNEVADEIFRSFCVGK